VERERQLLLQEIATRDDKPSGVAFEQFYRALFPSHPYRLSVQGERSSVERLSAAELIAYHRAFMDPAQLTLAVVGDVKAERVLALADSAFGRSASAVKPAPTVALDPPLSGPREAKKTLQKAQTQLVIGFRGLTVSDPDRHA